MKILLILIMIVAACMVLTYCIAAIKKTHKTLITFRITMLLLILLLLLTWAISLILKQPFHILLAMAVIFIIMYYYS